VRGGSAHRIGAQHRVLEDGGGFHGHGLDTHVERTCLAGGCHACFDQRQELVEDQVLQADGERQQTVEPALDGRQILLQDPVAVGELQTGPLGEFGEADAGQLAPDKEMEPGDERRLRIIALEIVCWIEQVLAAGLPLAARQGTEG
jgi:hypothetical protein